MTKDAANPVANLPKDFPEDRPVVMVNLLQFHEEAKYPKGSPHSPCSGQEAWLVRYTEIYRKRLEEAGGYELPHVGVSGSVVVGDENEKWDAVVLVKYPNLEAFRKAIGGDEYEATALVHREAALKRWKLIATLPVEIV
ncbi:hypothetical protein BKA61DRAFT_188100 [Leptodontidium sp. MPI-SDFR-AT-0119]|nr:hypothetical protein BKA61DRAFT_188100 [Leptodontidium sp. MPI-SDFR-AT-0119]